MTRLPRCAVPDDSKLVQELLDKITGLFEHAPIETRVAWSETSSS